MVHRLNDVGAKISEKYNAFMKEQTISQFTSPLTEEQVHILNQLLHTLNPHQVAWLGGFLTGLNGQAIRQQMPVVDAGPAMAASITVLFGSQTGNSEGIAKLLHRKAAEKGLTPAVKDMADYKPAYLKKEEILLVIASTHGEGDPPDTVVELYEFLFGKRAPKLDKMKFSVLALGDATYEHYCKIGRDFDQRLAELGAQRLYQRVDCDVDYDEAAETWIDGVLEEITKTRAAGGPAVTFPATALSATAESKYSKKNPFMAEILERINLNGRGSDKETIHMELSIEGSGLTYQPGDSLGIYPTNDPDMIDDLAQAVNFDLSQVVSTANGEMSLYDAFLREYEITTLTRPVISRYAELANAKDLNDLVDPANKEKLTEYLYGREIIDLVTDFPVKELTPAVFIGILRKLPARLYSIASSLEVHPDEAHIMVAVTRFHTHGRDRAGVCSTYLAERMDDDSKIPVYIDINNNFRIPNDMSASIIMIGPGTGVAPFRAFMEEREVQGGAGKNWLFFGDRHFLTNFSYQIEWQRYLKDGLLTRLDVAFSRDQNDKIYVQHRMRDSSREFFQWLEDGAYVYVCGDADQMAPDVHEALLQIIEKEGGKTRDQATEYVKSLQKQKRYQRDVY